MSMSDGIPDRCTGCGTKKERFKERNARGNVYCPVCGLDESDWKRNRGSYNY